MKKTASEEPSESTRDSKRVRGGLCPSQTQDSGASGPRPALMAEGRKAVLQVERRTWDTEEYQRRADERREEEERLEKEVRARSEHHFRACAPAGPRLPDGATGVLGAEGGCRCRKEADGRGHCAARPPQQGSVLTPESSAGSACRTLCPRSCLSSTCSPTCSLSLPYPFIVCVCLLARFSSCTHA